LGEGDAGASSITDLHRWQAPPVEVRDLLDVLPGCLRAQAEEKWDALVQKPTLGEVGGE